MWKEVKSELPESDRELWVSHTLLTSVVVLTWDERRGICLGVYFFGQGRWMINGTIGFDVDAPTHWMSLPKPPTV